MCTHCTSSEYCRSCVTFIHSVWLIHTCKSFMQVNHSCRWHVSFGECPLRFMCDTIHPYVWNDLFILQSVRLCAHLLSYVYGHMDACARVYVCGCLSVHVCVRQMICFALQIITMWLCFKLFQTWSVRTTLFLSNLLSSRETLFWSLCLSDLVSHCVSPSLCTVQQYT